MIERPSRQVSLLITGTGGPLGQSIMKAARLSALGFRIVATDMDPLSVGLFRSDVAYLLPSASRDPRTYMERLARLCEEEHVDVVCFGTEPEILAAISDPTFDGWTGSILACAKRGMVQAFSDKWSTFEVLRQHGLPVAETALASDREQAWRFIEAHGYPVVIKPRRGSGSQHLHVVKDESEAVTWMDAVPDAVVQEYLMPADQEYTVGVYKSQRTGFVGQIVLRRELKAGLTYKAHVVHDAEIEAVCRRVVEAVDVWGPINIQLRKTAAGVRIFEINLRFSSSAVMRAHFGFNEVELLVRDRLLGETLVQPEIRDGYALRYWDEMYIEGQDLPSAGSGGRVGETPEPDPGA